MSKDGHSFIHTHIHGDLMDLLPYKIRYGHMDDNGNEYWADAEATTAVHAADIICNLTPEMWEVHTYDINGKWNDVSAKIHHILVLYVAPAYSDGRSFSVETMKEVKRFINERGTN